MCTRGHTARVVFESCCEKFSFNFLRLLTTCVYNVEINFIFAVTLFSLSRPAKPTASKVTHNSTHLKWSAPIPGIERVKFYSVLYRRVDISAKWQTTKTQDSQTEVTVSGLTANAGYCFKVRAECEDGISLNSELSDLIQTSPPPVPGRPGKPNSEHAPDYGMLFP